MNGELKKMRIVSFDDDSRSVVFDTRRCKDMCFVQG